MWRLIADCEVCSSSAARLKFKCRAEHSKAVNTLVEGILYFLLCITKLICRI